MEVDYLFQIGDNIVYPMHGAGIIKAIEEKEISGEKRQYYVIKMSASNMEVMIPMGKILSSNIRPVTDIKALTNIIDIFQHGESDRLLTWKQRYKLNTDKIKRVKYKKVLKLYVIYYVCRKKKHLMQAKRKC